MVLRRCRRLLGDEERARDAMHDVFVQLLRREATLADSAPSSLLFRIATNVCLNLLRGDRRHPETRDEELLLQIAHAEDIESATSARRLLGRLFGPDRESTRTIAVSPSFTSTTV
jgi:RNA polymerase sigma-70 factor (ECF subfamily)